jgi:hypothetical protein
MSPWFRRSPVYWHAASRVDAGTDACCLFSDCPMCPLTDTALNSRVSQRRAVARDELIGIAMSVRNACNRNLRVLRYALRLQNIRYACGDYLCRCRANDGAKNARQAANAPSMS